VILPRSLAGLALAGVLLSGCGAPVGVHPGSAAIVGDASISLNKIDDTTRLYCEAYLPQLQQSQQSGPIPFRLLRQYVAASLAQRLLGEQLAAEFDVQPTSQYASHMSQVAQQFASTPAKQKSAVIDVEGGSPFLQTVQVALGRKLLAQSGQAAGGVKSALQRGEVATQDWLKSHTIEMDPVFGVAVDNGQFKPATGDDTSYPLSPIASAGADTTNQPSQSYTSALSAAQVCG
jgi:hypothetical protein